MSDLTETISKLPLAKKATPGQMILLALVTGGLLWTGARIGSYFDTYNKSILGAIQKVADATDKQGAEIDVLKKYKWSYADQQQWVHQLDKLNRTAVPALTVPDVPQPSAASTVSTSQPPL